MDLTPDAVSISKLKKDPVEIEIGIFEMNPEYKETENDEENLKNFYLKTGSFKAWIHPLTWMERDFIKADMVKVFRFWKEHDGEDKDIARSMSEEAVKRLLVFFALKRGIESKADRVFESQEELIDFHSPTITEINKRYYEEFALTEKERGNLLRVRNSKTLSDLPAISQGAISLEVNSQV